MGGLFKTQEAFYEVAVGGTHFTLLSHQPFALFGFLGEDVSFESFLESDLSGAGNLEPFFGTRVCFNLWHLLMRF